MQRTVAGADALSSSHTDRSPDARETALSTFSPREVQSRVRAGASAEEVAAETGWPHERVLRYAEPLLAERAYIAEQAQAVEVRRSGGGATLRQTAALALGVDPESDALGWDARRREDGKWVVTARFTDQGGARAAEWTYDHAGRNLHPLDDDARALMGVSTAARESADPITDALDLVAERVEVPEARPRLVAVPDAAPDRLADGESEPDVEPGIEPGSAAGADVDQHEPDDSGQTTIAIPHPSSPPAASSAEAPTKAATKPKGRKRRASVPSWDEILFGATKPEDD